MSTQDIYQKPCVYNCGIQIYWNASVNEYWEVFTKKEHICPNRSSSQSKPPSTNTATTTTNRPTYYNKFAKQQEVEAKENEIEEAIENASNKTVKESNKEANVIGDSDRE